MAQGFQGEGNEEGDVDPRDDDTLDEASRRWPASMPTASVAAVVLKIEEAITLKRTTGAAWLTAHGDAVPSLPVKPTRMELAVIIALAETYGAALHTDASYVFVLDFIADHGAVELVQRVMYGARPETDFDVTAFASKNALLADTLRDARFAFEFLCATWPEVFLSETHTVLAGIGVRVRAPESDLVPPSNHVDYEASDQEDATGEGKDEDGDDERGEGDHA